VTAFTSDVILDPYDYHFHEDPYPYYKRLRDEAPLYHNEELGFWALSRHQDVREGFRNSTTLSNRDGVSLDPISRGPHASKTMSFLAMDDPAHLRLRTLVSKGFTPRRVAGLRPRIEAITASLLDAIEARAAAAKEAEGEDAVDLIEGFAFPLPVTVICELLGIPVADQDQFRAWSNAIVADSAEPGAFRAAGEAMFRYFTKLVAAKRANPADDMVSALIEASDSGDSLNERELIAMLFLLLVAGHETTTNLIASGTLALLLNPAELTRLRADRSLLPGAVEELLRYVNPLNHATDRFTLEPVELGGVKIPAREWVLCATSSANMDPDRFPDASRLDVTRDAGGHVAFGHGIHFCLGAPLARLEAEIAFGALLSRFPSLSLAADPATLRWRQSSLIHGLETLPVRLA